MAENRPVDPRPAHTVSTAERLKFERARHALTQRNAGLLSSPSLDAPGAVTTTGATGIAVNPDKAATVSVIDSPSIQHVKKIIQTAKKTGKDIPTVRQELSPTAPPRASNPSAVTNPPRLVQGQQPRGVSSDVETLAFRGKVDIGKGRGIGKLGRGMSIATKLRQTPTGIPLVHPPANKGPVAVPGKTLDPTAGAERPDLQRKAAAAAEKAAARGEKLAAKAKVAIPRMGGTGQKVTVEEPTAPVPTETPVPQVDIPAKGSNLAFGTVGGDLGGGTKTAGIIKAQTEKPQDPDLERHAAEVAAERKRRQAEVDFRMNRKHEDMITTMTGYIMALYEREFSQPKRKKLAKKGSAMKDGSFPIENEKDLKNAERAIGRAHPSKRAKVRAHIRKRAAALGVSLKGTSFEA